MGAAKSPYVLDLSSGSQELQPIKKKRKTRKYSSDKPPKRDNQLKEATQILSRSNLISRQSAPEIEGFKISKENILQDLENIENYDAELALALSAEQSYASEESLPDYYLEYASKNPPDGPLLISGNHYARQAKIEELFYPKREQQFKTKHNNLKSFIAISALLTILTTGAFFLQNSSLFSVAKMFLGQSTAVPAQAERPSVFSSKNLLSLAASIGFNFEGLGKNFSTFVGLFDTAKDFYAVAPTLFGENEEKRYMLIFQNSSELRPTGGFIGSYATIDIKGGEITDIKIDGIYNLDGQTTVNVVPPKPFYHITSAWSAHDANWFLDFPASAEKIAWFYEKSAGESIDGVISLNINVLEKLIDVIGPIALPEYDIVLDSRNLRDEIQYEVEVGYDKELNRPKKIIADLFPILMENLSTALQSGEAQKDFAAIVLESFENRDIMLYSKDKNVQEFFVNHGWSGNLDPQNAGGDYLAVAHSNLGGYKTDKYIENFINYSVEIGEDGAVIAHVTVERKHNGGDLPHWWYNRQNIDYLKVYVPLGAEILSYSGGERRLFENTPDYDSPAFQKDAQIALSESEARKFGPIDIFRESGKTVFGTWLLTNPKSSSKLTLSYKLPFGVEFGDELAKYNLYIQKQPGADTQANFDILYPETWDLVWSKVESDFVVDKDKTVGYIFKR